MEIIDERGRLFGRVNVVDALVVLLAVAVAAAGFALAFGGGEPSPANGTGAPTPEPEAERTYATVVLGTHPSYVAGLVETGNVTVAGHNATITDVYRTPRPGDRALVVTRIRFEGNRTENGFVVGEKVVRYGTTVAVATPDYRIGGRVATVGGDRTLDTGSGRVVLNVSTSASVAEAVSAGDVQRVAGESVARVRQVERVGRENGTVHLRVTLTVETLGLGGANEYAGAALRIGRDLTVETDRYVLRGTVVDVEP